MQVYLVMPLQPYITKTYFGMDNPPVHLAGIAIGDGTLTSLETFQELPVITVLETYPQIIGYDTQVFEYFQEQCVPSRKLYALGMLIFCLGVNSAGTISPSSTLNRNTFQL